MFNISLCSASASLFPWWCYNIAYFFYVSLVVEYIGGTLNLRFGILICIEFKFDTRVWLASENARKSSYIYIYIAYDSMKIF